MVQSWSRSRLNFYPQSNKLDLAYEEISISAFYVGEKTAGLEACEKIILMKDIYQKPKTLP
jgi:hypothetical protein